MNRSTTAATTSISSEPPISPPATEHRWMSVVFLQGEDADRVLNMIDRSGPQRAIRHLSRWDFGDETRDSALVNGYVYSEVPQSLTDRVVHDDDAVYALTYNHRFGYVTLLRTFTPQAEDADRPTLPQTPWFALAGRASLALAESRDRDRELVRIGCHHASPRLGYGFITLAGASDTEELLTIDEPALGVMALKTIGESPRA